MPDAPKEWIGSNPNDFTLLALDTGGREPDPGHWHLDWELSIRIRGPPFRLRMFHLDWAGSIRELHNPFGFGAFHCGAGRHGRNTLDCTFSILIRALPFGSRHFHLDWAGSIRE